MKMTMTEAEALGRIKMGVNVDIKRSDGKNLKHDYHLNIFLFLSKKKFLFYLLFFTCCILQGVSILSKK